MKKSLKSNYDYSDHLRFDEVDVVLHGTHPSGKKFSVSMRMEPLNQSLHYMFRRPYKHIKKGNRIKFKPYDFTLFDLSLMVKSTKVTKKNI